MLTIKKYYIDKNKNIYSINKKYFCKKGFRSNYMKNLFKKGE